MFKLLTPLFWARMATAMQALADREAAKLLSSVASDLSAEGLGRRRGVENVIARLWHKAHDREPLVLFPPDLPPVSALLP